MNLEEQSVSNEPTPRPFIEIPKLWLQIGQMTEDFFAKEILHASATNTLYGVLIFTGISTLISIFQSLTGAAVNFFTKSSIPQTTNLITSLLFLCCYGVIVTPVSFYLNNGINYIVALIFGGKGKFNSQAYISSLYFMPLGLIASLASFTSLIPKIGLYIFSIILLGISVFHILFTIRSFKVVHSFTTGRAVASVLSPLFLLLIPICIIGILMAMGPVIGNVFSTINSSLNTPTP